MKGQWQEIERISGIPFRRTLPQRISANSRSGVDAELADRTTASLALDFHFASSISQATEADVVRLQRDLLAVEVESGSERERNRALEEENANLVDHLRELSDNLQVRSEELSNKENEMNILSSKFATLQNEKRRAEEELRARVKGLENELANQKKTEDELRFEQSSTLQELEKSQSRIAVYEERVQHLHSNLNDTIHTSKQRESKAIATVQAEAKQNTTILEAKLQSMNEQLLKAEEREQQASLRLEEARREASCTHKNMYNIIANERKELTASHSADVERMNLELDSAKKRLIRLSEEVQEANLCLAKQSEKSDRNLNDAENRMKEIKHELGSQSALCDKLQGELGQSAENIEMLEGCIVSLNAKLGQLEISKDNSDQSLQAQKATLAEVRHNHAIVINHLESSILDFVREKFKGVVSSQEIN